MKNLLKNLLALALALTGCMEEEVTYTPPDVALDHTDWGGVYITNFMVLVGSSECGEEEIMVVTGACDVDITPISQSGTHTVYEVETRQGARLPVGADGLPNGEAVVGCAYTCYDRELPKALPKRFELRVHHDEPIAYESVGPGTGKEESTLLRDDGR